MTVRQIWFTPWCSVKVPVAVGRAVLVPGDEVLAAATPGECNTIETLFAAHRDMSGRSVPTPAVLQIGADPLRELSDQERVEIHDTARTLAFLGIAGNDYFGGWRPPLNATCPINELRRLGRDGQVI